LNVAGKVERIKVLRSLRAAGSGVPGTTIDDALTVACGSGAVRLVDVQRSGKRAMTATELLRGIPIVAGTKLAAADH
jgi:methionyl-tRNA formyltransferase